MSFVLTIMDLEVVLEKPGCPICAMGRKMADH